jgi:hypothetical protein
MTRQIRVSVGDLELRYEHLGKHRDTPARKKRREQLHAHIDEIWAEQEPRNHVGVNTSPSARCLSSG